MIYYTKEHEWLRIDGDVAVVGITAHAAEALGELVFVEMREPGTIVARGDPAAVVESVKAASDIYAPVGGTLVAFNDRLTPKPALVNAEPESDGWIFTMQVGDEGELGELLDRDAYLAFVG
jgi:glycine cleavage system H protein